MCELMEELKDIENRVYSIRLVLSHTDITDIFLRNELSAIYKKIKKVRKIIVKEESGKLSLVDNGGLSLMEK